MLCCILSKFYIKPQHRLNHWRSRSGCILSKFYIKPQLWTASSWRSWVVSYRNSTSNHNFSPALLNTILLYLIEILHQTTTDWIIEDREDCCILSKFYIKPQLARGWHYFRRCCILSKFYIKPQLVSLCVERFSRCILSKFYIKPQPKPRTEA